MTGMADDAAAAHASLVEDQFGRQAERFAAAPALHNDAILSLLVDAAEPGATDRSLDVACGPGTVTVAFARRLAQAVGLDATPAMLDQARRLSAKHAVRNVEWFRGDVYALPFAEASFDIVSCRFAFHHFEKPQRAFNEMVRVCRAKGRIVLCDGLASDNERKAAALNRMERHRDPSTVAFRPLAILLSYFRVAGLPAPTARFFHVPTERDRLIAGSFPANGDRALLRRMIDESVEGDAMGMGSRRDRDTVLLAYPSVVLTARKPDTPRVTASLAP